MIGLADTSFFIARETLRPLAGDMPDELAVSVVTMGELRLGVLMATDIESRHRRLSTLQVASILEPIPLDTMVADAWAGMMARLRPKRMPLNDSWIAATAIAHDMAVVTQDTDYDEVPGLTVVKV